LPQHIRKNGSIPVYGSNGQIGLHNIAITNGPTIIVGRKGSIGEIKYSDVPCWIIDTAYYVRPLVQIDLRFLYRLLNSLNLSELNKSSAIPGLNRDDVYKLNIALPPLPEQRRIATVIDAQLVAVEKVKKAAEEQMALISAMPSSILRQAFSGEI
jgi:type I restriction enzyme S subunit